MSSSSTKKEKENNVRTQKRRSKGRSGRLLNRACLQILAFLCLGSEEFSFAFDSDALSSSVFAFRLEPMSSLLTIVARGEQCPCQCGPAPLLIQLPPSLTDLTQHKALHSLTIDRSRQHTATGNHDLSIRKVIHCHCRLARQLYATLPEASRRC